MTDLTAQVDEFQDLTQRFAFADDGLEYHDGPLTGWVTRLADGQVFAFTCEAIIPDELWHWKLSYVSRLGEAVAKSAQQDRWVSIVEDRRANTPKCSLVEIIRKQP